MMIQWFLLGVITAASWTASLFFVKFWRKSRDSFFLAFAAFFLAEGAIRFALLFYAKPNEGSPWVYALRLIALILILSAIVRKNYGASSRQRVHGAE